MHGMCVCARACGAGPFGASGFAYSTHNIYTTDTQHTYLPARSPARTHTSLPPSGSLRRRGAAATEGRGGAGYDHDDRRPSGQRSGGGRDYESDMQQSGGGGYSGGGGGRSGGGGECN